MLVKTVSFSDFLEEFKNYGREDQFSYEGKKALYDYLNDLSEDIGENIELDIIGLCCDFTEYNSIEEFLNDYSHTIGDINDIEDIRDYTTVIQINKSFIIQSFWGVSLFFFMLLYGPVLVLAALFFAYRTYVLIEYQYKIVRYNKEIKDITS